MMLLTYVLKALVIMRRKGCFKYMPNLSYLYYQLFNKKISYNKIEPQLVLLPMEILIGNIKKVIDESDLIIKVFEAGELLEHFESFKHLERNKCFRWNAFYPLYYIYITDSIRNDKFLIDYVCNWIDLYVVEMNANDFCWYDMADSFRLAFFVTLLSDPRIRNNLSKSNKNKISYAIYIHSKVIKNKYLSAKGNHRIFQLYSIVVFRKFCRIEELAAVGDLVSFYDEQFSKNGVHLEHSPEYHIWAVILFRNVFKNFNIKSESIKLAEINAREFFCTNALIPLVGDSGIEHSKQYWQLVGAKKRNVLFFNINFGGYIINRNDASGFYFISLYQENSKIHKHSDSGSFELTINNNKVITDAGKYSYGTDRFSQHFRTKEVHNNIYLETTNDIDFNHYFTKLIEDGALIKVVMLKSKLENKVHTRFLIFIEDCSLLVVDLLYEITGADKVLRLLDVPLLSNLNFITREYVAEYFQPLLGITASNIGEFEFSETYLKTNKGVALKLKVDALSAYYLGKGCVKDFIFTEDNIGFYVSGKRFDISIIGTM